MALQIEQALSGLVRIMTFAKRPFPNPSVLGAYRPSLEGLKRDESGLIMQLSGDRLDGGDSAHRTGVLAFCNSEQDARNLPFYMVDRGLMARHPTQVPWNNPNNCTRDQLTGYLAGLWRAGRSDIANELLNAHANRIPPFTCQDIENDEVGTLKSPPVGDLLAPHDIMYFRVCAGDYRASLDLSGQLALYISIVTASTAKDTELNQVLLHSVVCGQLDIFLASHSNYVDVLHEYWSGEPWRGQRSIATSLIDVINIESGRYSSVDLLDLLLPQHLLEELRNIDLEAEIKAFLALNPEHFAQLAARFLVAALRDVQDHIETLERTLQTLNEFGREIAVALIVSLRAYAADAFGQVSKAVKDSHIDPTGIVSTVLSVTAAILGLGASSNEEADRQFRAQVTQSLAKITQNTEIAIKAIGDLQKSMEVNFEKLAATVKSEFYDLALGELKGSLQNAGILLNLREEGVLDPLLTQRLEIEVDVLRRLVFRIAEKYGAGTIGYCLQAYGVIVALLNAAGHSDIEIAETRKTFAAGWARDLLYATDGPLAQLKSLRDVEESESKMFAGMQRELLIGVRSVQGKETIYPPHNGGEPVIVGLEEWHVTGYFCQIVGGLEQPALVTVSLVERPLGIAMSEVAAPQSLRQVTDVLPWKDAVFIIHNATKPRVGSVDAINVISQARGDQARKSAQNWLNSRRLQPDLEVLIMGAKASFGI